MLLARGSLDKVHGQREKERERGVRKVNGSPKGSLVLGFRVEGSGFRVWGLGLGFRV